KQQTREASRRMGHRRRERRLPRNPNGSRIPSNFNAAVERIHRARPTRDNGVPRSRHVQSGAESPHSKGTGTTLAVSGTEAATYSMTDRHYLFIFNRAPFGARSIANAFHHSPAIRANHCADSGFGFRHTSTIRTITNAI